MVGWYFGKQGGAAHTLHSTYTRDSHKHSHSSSSSSFKRMNCPLFSLFGFDSIWPKRRPRREEHNNKFDKTRGREEKCEREREREKEKGEGG